MLAKFITSFPNSTIIFKDGTKLVFNGPMLTLTDEAKIKELRDTFIVSGYVREIPPESEEFEDPVERLKRLAVEEHLKKSAEGATVKEVAVGAVEIKAPATPVIPTTKK